MDAQDHPSELARAKRDQYAAPGLHAVAQRFGQGIREQLIQRHGGVKGYFRYVQKLDRSRRQRGRQQLPKKTARQNARTSR